MRLTVIVLALGLGGCASRHTVIKIPEATGGSRSDGVVELSYEYAATERILIDWEVAATKARQRCQAWGYGDAQPFGGSKSACQIHDEGYCKRYFVTVPYQCVHPVELPKPLPPP